MTNHTEASLAALHDLMTGDGSTSHYRSTAAVTHALHDIADAIRGLAPKPVEIKTGMTFPPGFAAALAVDAMASRGKRSQVATGGDLAASQQPEPGEVGRGEAAELVQQPFTVNLLSEGAVFSFKNTWVWLGDVVRFKMATGEERYVPERRAEKAEAERDEAAKLSHQYRNERDTIINDLRELADGATQGGDRILSACFRDVIARHTPEG